MWGKHRRVSTEMGAEHNAARQSVTLVDRKTGRERTVPAERAERLARKAGLVERTHYGRATKNVCSEFLLGMACAHRWSAR
jgi:hypothetical protein